MATLTATALPQLDLRELSTITVDTQDVTAHITKLVVHFSQDTPEQVLQQVTVAPLFVYGPNE